MEVIKKYTLGLIFSFVITLIGISLTAIIFAYTNIKDIHMQSFVFGTILFSVLIGSTYISKSIRKKGLILGGIFGVLYCLILYILSVVAYNGIYISNTLLIYLLISFVSGVIGGIIGVNI